MRQKLHPNGGLYLDPRTVRFMLTWLVLCFTGLLGPIANWAHTFGLLAGGIIGGGSALRNGGWKTLRRRHEFRRAIIDSAGAIHGCEVCGKTEQHDPDLEFRVCSDGREYCEQHLMGESPDLYTQTMHFSRQPLSDDFTSFDKSHLNNVRQHILVRQGRRTTRAAFINSLGMFTRRGMHPTHMRNP